MAIPERPDGRVENYLANLIGQETAWEPGNPESRVEEYLDYILENGTKTEQEMEDDIAALKSIGRYLSLWDAATGLPVTNPKKLPYTYKTGDYYIVSNVDTTTNYMPSGIKYEGTASVTTDSGVKANDYYVFDGTTWSRLAHSGGGGSNDGSVLIYKGPVGTTPVDITETLVGLGLTSLCVPALNVMINGEKATCYEAYYNTEVYQGIWYDIDTTYNELNIILSLNPISISLISGNPITDVEIWAQPFGTPVIAYLQQSGSYVYTNLTIMDLDGAIPGNNATNRVYPITASWRWGNGSNYAMCPAICKNINNNRSFETSLDTTVGVTWSFDQYGVLVGTIGGGDS